MAADRDPLLALGELRGMLAALAWANTKCNHGCTFTIEDLPDAGDVHESLTRHFDEEAAGVSLVPLADWHAAVGESLRRWLFLFHDSVESGAVCALTDEGHQRELVASLLRRIVTGVQPVEVWRVTIRPSVFYECDWDDFAFRGSSGLYLLHLGVSD